MTGQRSTRGGKAHREAFPALDILKAERSLREGRGVCRWFDERGQPVGHAEVHGLDDQQATFRYDFAGSANITASGDAIKVDVDTSRRNPLHVRRSFSCPCCTAPVQKLFFVSEAWACGKCHDLVFLKQRLGSVNKKLLSRDKMLAELMQMTGPERRTRWFYNRQRHVERINRELVDAGFSSLPQELLYRTDAQWGDVGDINDVRVALANDSLAEQRPGLAFFQPVPKVPLPVAPGEFKGSKVLYKPIEIFWREYQAEQFEAVERDIKEGRAVMQTRSSNDFAAMLAKRLILPPLALTGEWSEMVETTIAERQCEYKITASYQGSRDLWRFGPGTKVAENPLLVILDDDTVTLCLRLPETGRTDPRADLIKAATKLEALLTGVRTKVDALNATMHAAAARQIRSALSEKRRRPG